ncbi:hypothetical protein GR183_14250 [Stappia sp. GBMRC 2046]|uniref:Ceramidase n=1 Tax=Stappia sediminis TaxID=2692190 RepID=A0A7X3LVW5_9HYPH|nr:ceramidase domain-containing protein [Stappia sediminis]MXN66072.1 hypothetical protein [Stappia sediminis]
MDWFRQVDVYCERADASFWAEPLNAITNIAFLIAAGLIALSLAKARPADLPAWILTGLVAVIGVGSFLFHTLATRWALLADVLPISIFIYSYLFLAMRRFFGFRIISAIGIVVVFGVISYWWGEPLSFAFGSTGSYVPAFLAMVITGLALLGKEAGTALGLFGAAAVFAVSMSFRMLDAPVCAEFPHGTHFIWHILNATTLYILLRVFVRARERG